MTYAEFAEMLKAMGFQNIQYEESPQDGGVLLAHTDNGCVAVTDLANQYIAKYVDTDGRLAGTRQPTLGEIAKIIDERALRPKDHWRKRHDG